MKSMTIATMIDVARAGTAASPVSTHFTVRAVAPNGARGAGEKSVLSTYGASLACSGHGPWSAPV